MISLAAITYKIEYKKWMVYFSVHLEKLYDILIRRFDLEYTEGDYQNFCLMMYKKSSRRIPKY